MDRIWKRSVLRIMILSTTPHYLVHFLHIFLFEQLRKQLFILYLYIYRQGKIWINTNIKFIAVIGLLYPFRSVIMAIKKARRVKIF